ncbi:MAG: hypothetical protein NTZ13_00525 [Candidatus Parcubacteria bacterium]|nr:hypothetical protein [Candidatus Parcubacteria bacterium]
MKFQFGIEVNDLPDFLDGKAVTLHGYCEDKKIIRVELDDSEVVITRKQIRDSFFGTLIALKEAKPQWEKHHFSEIKKPPNKIRFPKTETPCFIGMEDDE